MGVTVHLWLIYNEQEEETNQDPARQSAERCHLLKHRLGIGDTFDRE